MHGRDALESSKNTQVSKTAAVSDSLCESGSEVVSGPLTLLLRLLVTPLLQLRLRGRCVQVGQTLSVPIWETEPHPVQLPGATPSVVGSPQPRVHRDWPVTVTSCSWPRPSLGFGQ